jgi:hypothetical protein
MGGELPIAKLNRLPADTWVARKLDDVIDCGVVWLEMVPSPSSPALLSPQA